MQSLSRIILKIIPFFLTWQVYAGDLVSGLERTNNFLTSTLVPVISVFGLICAGFSFYYYQGREAWEKAFYILAGTAIIYASGWAIDQIHFFFGR